MNNQELLGALSAWFTTNDRLALVSLRDAVQEAGLPVLDDDETKPYCVVCIMAMSRDYNFETSQGWAVHELFDPENLEMENIIFPLGVLEITDRHRDSLRDLPVTVVVIDGENYLAMTAGGSLEICMAYFRLGYYPPVYFVKGLTKLSGIDKSFIDACLESLKINAKWADRAMQRFVEEWG